MILLVIYIIERLPVIVSEVGDKKWKKSKSMPKESFFYMLGFGNIERKNGSVSTKIKDH